MDLAGLAGADSESAGALLGEDLAAADDLRAADDSGNDSDVSVEEAECLGCGVTSKKMCPVSVLRQAPKLVKWARYRKKQLPSKRGRVIRKLKVPSGKWCINCFKFWRSNFKKDVPHLEDWEDKMREKPHLKAKWRKMNGNYIKVKGGGKARIRTSKRVSKRSSVKEQLVDDNVYFYLPSAYKKKFGCPKENKAKPYTVTKKDGTKIQGYVVRHGEEGVFKLKNIVENETVLDDTLLGEEEQLHDEHGVEAFAEAQAFGTVRKL